MKPRDLAILFFLLAFAMLFYSFANAGCLTRDQAAKTWPTRELTRDGDGCWTFWRKGLRHETSAVDGLPARTDVLQTVGTTVSVQQTEPLPDLWITRWPETQMAEYRRIVVERDPPPVISTRLVVIIAVSISLTLAVIEVLWGDKIMMKIKERNDGYWT